MRQKNLAPYTRFPVRLHRRRPGVVVPVRRADSGEIAFELVFYNIELRRLTSVMFMREDATPAEIEEAGNVGGALIRKSLRARGFDPDDYVCSILDIYIAHCMGRRDDDIAA
jgi:hypothetical protein